MVRRVSWPGPHWRCAMGMTQLVEKSLSPPRGLDCWISARKAFPWSMSIQLPLIVMSMGDGVELGCALVPEVVCASISCVKDWGGPLIGMLICIWAEAVEAKTKTQIRANGMRGCTDDSSGIAGRGAGRISGAGVRRSGDQMRSGGRGAAVVPGADASGGWLCASIAVSCALVMARMYGVNGDAGTCTGAVLVQAGAWLTPRPFAPGSGQWLDWLGQQECAQACAGHTGTQTMATARRMARHRAAGRTA